MSKITKEEIIKIMQDNLVSHPCGNTYYKVINSIETIADIIINKVNEPKVRKTYLSKHAPDGVALIVTANSIEGARKLLLERLDWEITEENV